MAASTSVNRRAFLLGGSAAIAAAAVLPAVAQSVLTVGEYRGVIITEMQIAQLPPMALSQFHEAVEAMKREIIFNLYDPYNFVVRLPDAVT